MCAAWQSILSGGAIAILAFLLAVGWDVLKARRERARRDQAVLAAAIAETEAVIATVSNDRNLIRDELALLAKGQRLINPIDPIEGGFWDVVKFDPPAALLREQETLAHVRDISRRTDQTNEMIRSREAFRVANQALGSFNQHMEAYDKLLNTWLSELLDALNKLKPILEDAARRSARRM